MPTAYSNCGTASTYTGNGSRFAGQSVTLLRAGWHICLACLLCSFLLIAHADQAQPTLRQIRLEINGHLLTTEVAMSNGERQRGLSFRTQLGEHEAMLFVYQKPRRLLFTMQDTLIPLSIAFIDNERRIDQILPMEPGTGGIYGSREQVQYALEVNQGWFKRHDVNPGATVRFLDPL